MDSLAKTFLELVGLGTCIVGIAYVILLAVINIYRSIRLRMMRYAVEIARFESKIETENPRRDSFAKDIGIKE